MTNDHRRAIPKTRYGAAVDVPYAADLYAQGWTLHQIAAQLDLTETTVAISYVVLGSLRVADLSSDRWFAARLPTMRRS